MLKTLLEDRLFEGIEGGIILFYLFLSMFVMFDLSLFVETIS